MYVILQAWCKYMSLSKLDHWVFWCWRLLLRFFTFFTFPPWEWNKDLTCSVHREAIKQRPDMQSVHREAIQFPFPVHTFSFSFYSVCTCLYFSGLTRQQPVLKPEHNVRHAACTPHTISSRWTPVQWKTFLGSPLPSRRQSLPEFSEQYRSWPLEVTFRFLPLVSLALHVHSLGSVAPRLSPL